MSRAITFFLLAGAFIACSACGNISGLDMPYVASPLVKIQTPASPASGDIIIAFNLIDREVEPADITVEYSINGGTTYSAATLTIPGDALSLASAYHPGKTHSVTWNSVTDMVGRSGAVSVCVKITPSDASNPSGEADTSASFTVDNTAFNQAPSATLATPSGVKSGNVQINYFLADVESDTCSIAVLYSINNGTIWQAATMGPAGDGVTGLSSSPSGTAHVYLWDSRADNVAPSGQVDTVKIRITPTDFIAGTSSDTNSFSVDNSVANDPPTVTITGGPADGSTVATTQVTFTWSGSDTDGSVVGYYYSFDHDPPDVWTTGTTITSGALSAGGHTFRVVSVDDDSDLSTAASRTFTVQIYTIDADFTASPTAGSMPLVVNFMDESAANFDIDTWLWDFGDGGSSTEKNPKYIYTSAGIYTVSLTASGPFGSDTETKTGYIAVTDPAGGQLNAPASLSCDPTGTGSIEWSWTDTNTSPNEEGYRVYDAGDDSVLTVPDLLPDTTLWVETGLSENTEYSRYVKAIGGGGTETLDQEYTSYTQKVYVDNTQSMAQSFTVGLAGTLTKVLVAISRFPASTLPVEVALCADSGGLPGTSLTSTSRDDILKDDTGRWEEFAFSPGVAVTPGQVYWITLTNGDTSMNGYGLLINNAGAYAGGLVAYNTGAPPWTELPAYDASFSTYVNTGGGGTVDSNPSATVSCYTLVHTPTAGDYTVSDTGAGSVQVDIIPPPNPTAGLTGVRVERADDAAFTINKFVVQDTTAVYSLTDTVPSSGTYWYRIRFQNGDGYPSAYSPGKSVMVAPPANTPPVAEILAPSGGTFNGDVTVSYTLTDAQSDTCSIVIEYSTDGGASWSACTAAGGDGTSGLDSSTTGATHTYVWDSVADGVGTVVPQNVRVSITPSDAAQGTPDSTDFTVNNSGPVGPTANFTAAPTTGPAALIVNFTDTSSGTYDSRYWDFGDGGYSTAVSPAHTYLLTGTYTVTLTIDGPAGSDSETKTAYITVTDPGTITADFKASELSGSPPFTVDFNDLSVGNITSWSWDFGDGGTSTQRSPTYTYNTYGLFTVELTVSGPAGSDTETKTGYISVTEPGTITADFSAAPVSGLAPLTVSFMDLSTSTSGITSWSWNFGDTLTSTAQHPTHTYNSAGIYTVTLTVSGPNGADMETKTDYITVNLPPPPTAGFSAAPTNGYVPLTVNFTDESAGSVTGWSWDFGDGGTSTQQNPSYTYTTAGTYTVTLTVTGPGGSDNETKINYILAEAIPQPEYGWTYRMGGPAMDKANGVCCDAAGNIFISGYFWSATPNFAEDWSATDVKTNAGEIDTSLTSVDASGNYSWTRRIGAASSDEARAVCMDGSGNVYLTGRFSSTSVNFADDWGESDIKTSAGSYEIYLAKVDSSDSYCWTHRIGGTSSDSPWAICADASANVFLTGSFYSTVNFANDWGGSDSKTTVGSSDVFITKVDMNGNYGWSHRMGGTGADAAKAVCTDSFGNIYLAGNYSGTTVNFAEDWGGSDIKTGAGSSDIFITKLDSNGDYCWTYVIGSADADRPYAMCADTNNNIYMVGEYGDTINFEEDWGGTDIKTGAGGFITKIEPTGTYCWTHRTGRRVSGVCTDADDNVYMTGYFIGGSINFAGDWGGTDNSGSAGGMDIFVTKIDSQDRYHWSRRIGGSDSDYPMSICMDGSGSLYVTGYFTGSVNFAEDWAGTDDKTSAGAEDMFITKITQP